MFSSFVLSMADREMRLSTGRQTIDVIEPRRYACTLYNSTTDTHNDGSLRHTRVRSLQIRHTNVDPFTVLPLLLLLLLYRHQ